MPRKTPVRELQKEEPVVSSPLRRSSRLNASSPVPTKVLTRRSSASEVPTPAATITRSRRSSLSQESQSNTDGQSDKEKPTSTIRTRRSSLTQNNETPVQEEPVQRTRTRGSSVTKEQTSEVKKTTRRRNSVSEDSEVDSGSTKITRSRSGSITKKEDSEVDSGSTKSTRSRSASITKKDDDDDLEVPNKKQTSSVKDVAASTPVKKKSSSPQSITGVLESIEEINKEVDSFEETVVTQGKKKSSEPSKIDFDLSVINEASLTEEELSPQKRNQSKLETKNEADCSGKEPEIENNLKENISKSSKSELDVSKVNNVSAIVDKSCDKKSISDHLFSHNNKKSTVELDSSLSDGSFNLQLSSSALENKNKSETDDIDVSNKENVCPVYQSECEPMDVDDSVLEFSSLSKSIATESSPKTTENKENGIEQDLQIAENATDEIANFLSEEIQVESKPECHNKAEDLKISSEPVVEEGKNIIIESVTENEASKMSSGKVVINVAETSVESETYIKDGTENFQGVAITTEKRESINTEGNVDLVGETDILRSEKSINNKDVLLVEKHSSHKQSPIKQSPVKQSPIKQTPIKQSPIKQTPVKQSPTKQSSTKQSPIKPNEPLTGVQNEMEIVEEPVGVESVSSENKGNVDASESTISVEMDNITQQENDGICSKTDYSVVEIKGTGEVNEIEGNTSDKIVLKEINTRKDYKNVILHKDFSVADLDNDINKEVIVVEREMDSNNLDTEKDNNDALSNVEVIVEEVVSSDNELNLEVTKINAKFEELGAVQQDEAINLCDSVSEQDVDSSEDDDTYRSPIKKVRTHLSLGDDEVFTRKDAKVVKRDIFDSSVIEFSDNEEENNQITDVESPKNKENDVNNLNYLDDVKIEENKDLSNENEGKEVCTENSLIKNDSKKHSSDTASIVLQETLPAGSDPEKSLSGRIHNVVDLFCASLKNKSDISVNVSFECTGQGSDSEDENTKSKVIEVSFTASGIDGTEAQAKKGIKRRKICRDSCGSAKSQVRNYDRQSVDNENPSKTCETTDNQDNVTSMKYCKKRHSIPVDSFSEVHQSTPKFSDKSNSEERVTSDKKSKKRLSVENKSRINSSGSQSQHNDTFETSKISVSLDDEETDKSDKKSKKRKSFQHDASRVSQPVVHDVTKTSLKTSVTFDVDDKIKSPNENKTRRSTISDTERIEESVAANQKESPAKKRSIPGTPFKSLNVNGNFDAESSDVTELSTDDENSTQSYGNILSMSFVESDINDTTWNAQADTDSSDLNSDESDLDVGEEESDEFLLENSVLINEKRRPKGGSRSSTDDVFVDAVVEKEKSPAESKKRKLFRLSRYDIAQAAASFESEESMKVEEKQKRKKQRFEGISGLAESSEAKTKINKPKRITFIRSKNVNNMQPQTSEMQESGYEKRSNKTKHFNSQRTEGPLATKRKAEKMEDLRPKKKEGRDVQNKYDLRLQIKPSAGKGKNAKPLSMRPSTKTTHDWEVTTFT